MLEMIQEGLQGTFLGNRIMDYCISILLFVAAVLAIKIVQRLVISRLKRWAEKTATTLDDFLVGLVQNIVVPLAYFGAFYIGIKALSLPGPLKKGIDVLAMAVLTFCAARLAVVFITYSLDLYLSKRGGEKGLKRSLTGILRVAKLIVWSLAIVFFLDNLGFRISAVIAGLGIGGVAVALAAQAVLGDLFSYFAILFDRPFEIGDFIIVNEYLGAVEHVGIKTTRIRSLGGEQLIFSNTDLTNSRVRNYKRMEKRRVVFKLGVVYQTPLKQLQEIPGIIENVIKNTKDTAFDRAHFFSYGDFSLVFEIVYYVMGADYNKYMDTQQQINFAIKKEFEERRIEFAYPTQMLYVSKEA